MDEKTESVAPQDIVLTITLKPGSKYPEVTGPLNDEPLIFYMLEYTRLSVIQRNNQPPKIEKPGGIINFARRFRA